MTAAAILLAALLCGVLVLTSYLTALYVETLRLRPHPNALSFERFEEQLQPKLGFESLEGLRRFAMVRQLTFILLALDLAYINGSEGLTLLRLGESLAIAVGAMALFAHIVPSILVTRTEGAWALGFVPAAVALAWAIQPLVLLASFANSVAELGGEAPPDRTKNGQSDDIEALLDAGEEQGLIGQEDRKLIQSVVEFGDKTVREAMTPRPNIVAIEASRSVEDLRDLLIEEEYSRIPVYDGTIDNVVGFVHSRDTMEIEECERSQMRVRELARPIVLAPETKPIRELMRDLQQKNAQMAIVVDEYGQTAGLVTMEDMMEEIVGEIRDESEPATDIVEHADGSFTASGNLDLDRLEELVDFSPGDDIESTTVGGLVCERLGQVPDPGAKLQLDGIEVEVVSADERRVRSIRIRRLKPPRKEAEGAPAPAPKVQTS